MGSASSAAQRARAGRRRTERVMTTRTAESRAAAPLSMMGAMALRMIWAGCAAAVLVAIVANIAVEAVPHTRGIGFFPHLRYALVTPACWIGAIAAAFLYGFLNERSSRPKWTLGALFLALALVPSHPDANGCGGAEELGQCRCRGDPLRGTRGCSRGATLGRLPSESRRRRLHSDLRPARDFRRPRGPCW